MEDERVLEHNEFAAARIEIELKANNDLDELRREKAEENA